MLVHANRASPSYRLAYQVRLLASSHVEWEPDAICQGNTHTHTYTHTHTLTKRESKIDKKCILQCVVACVCVCVCQDFADCHFEICKHKGTEFVPILSAREINPR